MTIDNKVRDEKLKCDINREAAELLTLSFGKIDKYEYLIRKEIISPDQRRVIEVTKFAYLLQEKLLRIKQKQLNNK